MKMRLIRLMGGFQDTRTNEEDFALTPYIGLVYVNIPYTKYSLPINKSMKVIGLSLTWGFYCVHLSLGFNIPKEYPLFKILKK